MPNRLANATSPYLLQHQNNPVDWYPWCEEAFDKARHEQKPVFLSIGYSACHWCHVMEHESFENPSIASILNENFVSIKVDREQRPDLDQIYMQTVQMLTGSGGWPMSVFLTPDAKPFYGGTYWPPEARWGKPGFAQVLHAVADAWRTKRDQIEQQGNELVGHLQDAALTSAESNPDPLVIEDLQRADHALRQSFERLYGGFGGAPKFPHTMDLTLLLQLQTRWPSDERMDVIEHTLRSMANGGIYDHLGGGFSRYSVDDQWLVPHFEKMLYDNALLAGVYLDAFAMTKNPRYREVVEGTLNYLLRDMKQPEGGFSSAEDADSEGEEGKFYVWKREEIYEVLGTETGERFCEVYDVTFGGNFEGHNILNLIVRPNEPKDRIASVAARYGIELAVFHEELRNGREKLLEIRSKRIRPGLDDKVLVSWNALAIDVFARAASVLGRPDYLEAAQACATFVLQSLRRPDGRLLHVWRKGEAEIDAFLDDYAYFLQALISLYESDWNLCWLEVAIQIAETMIAQFRATDGGFYFTAEDAEKLIARTQDTVDHSIPSGSGMAATALLRLSTLVDRSDFSEQAESTLRASAGLMRRSPSAAGQLLIALDWLQGPIQQWVVICPKDFADVKLLTLQLHQDYNPRRVLLIHREADQEEYAQRLLGPLLRARSAMGKPTLYLCEGTTCQAPRVIDLKS